MLDLKDRFAEAARLIQRDFLEPADIWNDVCALPTGAAPIVACIEMAFARLAVIEFLLQRHLPPSSARADLLRALSELMQAELSGGGSERVYGRALPAVAREAVALYGKKAQNPTLITEVLLDRLGCRAPPDQYAYLLERFGKTFSERVLKVSPAR